jgi:hypothetical protein
LGGGERGPNPNKTLKKPFSLLLILSHLSAFALGGVGNVYAVNQEIMILTKVLINLEKKLVYQTKIKRIF